MTTTLPVYYALWYYFNDGEISATAISLNSKSLKDLYLKTQNDPNCLYHTYKHHINLTVINPIRCYLYNTNTKSIEEITDENKSEIIDGAFYATNYFPFTYPNIIKEVLIYMSKKDHEEWRKCCEGKNMNVTEENTCPLFFYEELISNHEVLPDVYYDEGIMNA
jgi:hypothetical protein